MNLNPSEYEVRRHLALIKKIRTMRACIEQRIKYAKTLPNTYKRVCNILWMDYWNYNRSLNAYGFFTEV